MVDFTRLHPIAERLPDLIFWITLPFLGAERAAAEREQVRQAKRTI